MNSILSCCEHELKNVIVMGVLTSLFMTGLPLLSILWVSLTNEAVWGYTCLSYMIWVSRVDARLNVSQHIDLSKSLAHVKVYFLLWQLTWTLTFAASSFSSWASVRIFIVATRILTFFFAARDPSTTLSLAFCCGEEYTYDVSFFLESLSVVYVIVTVIIESRVRHNFFLNVSSCVQRCKAKPQSRPKLSSVSAQKCNYMYEKLHIMSPPPKEANICIMYVCTICTICVY